jgi:hypothetical protein
VLSVATPTRDSLSRAPSLGRGPGLSPVHRSMGAALGPAPGTRVAVDRGAALRHYETPGAPQTTMPSSTLLLRGHLSTFCSPDTNEPRGLSTGTRAGPDRCHSTHVGLWSTPRRARGVKARTSLWLTGLSARQARTPTATSPHGASWSPRNKWDAIRDIENSNGHDYHVPWKSGRTEIRVVEDSTVESGKYLRTDRNDTSENNLRDLPDC